MFSEERAEDLRSFIAKQDLIGTYGVVLRITVFLHNSFHVNNIKMIKKKSATLHHLREQVKTHMAKKSIETTKYTL